MRWQDIHIYYYDDSDPLILHALRPLFRRLGGQVPAMYYTRHWLRGPHIRLSLRTDAETLTQVVRPAVEEIVGSFLEEQPSMLRLDPAHHLRTHRQLAELEAEHGPLSPWRADNSIHYVPHDRRLHVLGSEAAADLLGGFYTEATELAFDLTERIAAGDQRAMLAFDLMITTAHTMSGSGIAGGFGSFRSHAEGALHGQAEGLRLAWDEHLRRHVRALAKRVSAVVETADGERGGRQAVPSVREWAVVLSAVRQQAERLIAEGGLSAHSLFPLDKQYQPRDLADLSQFHRETYGDPDWPRIQSSDRFTLYRLMLNYTYLHLTRIGLRPRERYLMCHLAAGAAEECCGISALQAFRRYWKAGHLESAGAVRIGG